MKDFFNYTKGYTKRKIYRAILFILIAVVFFCFKSCNVNALKYFTGTTSTTFNLEDCLEFGTSFKCIDGVSLTYNNTLGSYHDYEHLTIFNNLKYNTIIKSIHYKFHFSSNFTTSSTNQFIDWYYFNGDNFTNYNNNGISAYNPDFYFYNDSVNYIPANYNFKPYYCTYLNVTTGSTDVCNVAIYTYSGRHYLRVLDIPVNTTINDIQIFIGTFRNYVGSTKVISNHLVPNDYAFFKRDSETPGSKQSNYFGVTWNDYFNNINQNNYGLFFIPKGIDFGTSNNYFSRGWFRDYINSNDFYATNNSYTYNYKFDFINMNLQQEENIQNEINSINEQSIVISNAYGNYTQGDADSDENTLNSAYTGFSNNVYANNFTSLFSSLFSYPIQLLYNQSNLDLVNSNYLDPNICNPDSGLSDFWNPDGGYSPINIYLWKNYSFSLPCMHYEIYPQIAYGSYGFYGSSFKGVSLSSTVRYGFADIWLIIQHGILVYLLFVTVLNIYKYIIDPNKVEVEVLDL